jgi:hypothetical protein
MDKVALLDASNRAALFGETGAVRGVANTGIEKDFWGLLDPDCAVSRCRKKTRQL